jgi:hypothetical protein
MKKYTPLIPGATLAFLLGAGIFVQIYIHKKQFNKTVTEALKTSDGYDKDFIRTVNRLEEVLATRASFGYTGNKDPMTGKLRTVAKVALPEPKISGKKEPAAASPIDPCKLTAIIYDDESKKFTAIIMMDERSFAVEVGDKVGDRKITRITSGRIFMEDDSLMYYYDISGEKKQKPRNE